MSRIKRRNCTKSQLMNMLHSGLTLKTVISNYELAPFNAYYSNV